MAFQILFEVTNIVICSYNSTGYKSGLVPSASHGARGLEQEKHKQQHRVCLLLPAFLAGLLAFLNLKMPGHHLAHPVQRKDYGLHKCLGIKQCLR